MQQTESFTWEQYTLVIWQLPFCSWLHNFLNMHKKQKRKKGRGCQIQAFWFLLLLCLLLAGLWVLWLTQQSQTLWYPCPKRMSTEWSVPRSPSRKLPTMTNQVPEVPGTQLGPKLWVSLAGSQAPAAGLPQGPEGKPMEMKKLAILGTWWGTHPCEPTLAGFSKSFVDS